MTVLVGRRSCVPTRTCRRCRRRTLSITKVATETSYDAVGDVIHYTIVATNDGQRDAGGGDGHGSERDAG